MIEQVNNFFVNWNKSKVVKNALCSGKKYATYYDKNCLEFRFWLSRKEINEYKKQTIGA